MGRNRIVASVIAALLAISFIVGCGGDPELEVAPSVLDFGSTASETRLTVWNAGKDSRVLGSSPANLRYNLAADRDWITLSHSGGTSSGEKDHLVVRINRSRLSNGRNTGTISVTSNGGSKSVAVIAAHAGPECRVSPATLNFGEVCVGNSKDKAFTIANIGQGQLVGTVSENCNDYGLVGNASFSLSAGQSKTFTVRFQPTSAGVKGCKVHTGSDCQIVSCTGVGIEGTCQVSPTTLDFGDVCVGASEDRTFEIRCPSSSACTISGSVSESCAHYRIISGGGSYTLSPGQRRTVKVRFSPTSSGTKTCTINTGSGCSNVSCTGSGAECRACEVEPSSLDFGELCVGESRSKTFTITCPPSSPSSVSGTVSENSSHYQIVSGTGSYTLSPGESRTVTVQFSPTSSGTKAGVIDTGSDCSNVSCTGVGIEGTCQVSPTTLDFGDVCVGASEDRTFEIRCPSSSACTISGSVSESCAHYRIISGGGSYTLSPGQRRTVKVRFSPTSSGTKTCTISTGSACSNVSCTGVGDSNCVSCVVNPTNLDFGDICVGSSKDKTFTITCPPTNPRSISGTVSSSSSRYRLISGGGSYTLNPGASRTVTVRFEPTSSGPKTCTISTGSGCSDVSCTGVGVRGMCQVRPTAIDFGDVCVGGSKDKRFTISCHSDSPCPISGTLSGDCSSYSIVSGSGSFTLNPGQALTVTVRFQPASVRNWTCTINTGSGCSNVIMKGDGVEGSCGVSPRTLNFGDVCVGDYKDKTFRISCGSSSPCPISGRVSENCSRYTIVSGGGSYTLNPGDSRKVTVRFSPGSSGTKNCTISTGTGCSDVSCRGVGVEGRCSVSPRTLDFGDVCVGNSQDLEFTIHCPSSSPCPISGQVSENCTRFSIVSGSGSYTLNPGQRRTVAVRYRPTSPGRSNCTISTGAACDDVSCSGEGAETAYIMLKPTASGVYFESNRWSASEMTLMKSGVSYEDPSWNHCEKGWRVNGDATWERGWYLKQNGHGGVYIPAGCTKLRMKFRADAENTCAEILVEIDGREFHIENPSTSCRKYSPTFNWPYSNSAGYRKILVGTNNVAWPACYKDIVFVTYDFNPSNNDYWIYYEFEGVCASSKAASGGIIPVELVVGELEDMEPKAD